MCFHTEQTKFPFEVETRFKAKIKDLNKFKPSAHFNGFNFPQTPVIIDENPAEILQSTLRNGDDGIDTINVRLDLPKFFLLYGSWHRPIPNIDPKA